MSEGSARRVRIYESDRLNIDRIHFTDTPKDQDDDMLDLGGRKYRRGK